jgi:uncharacterized protein YndB with AHSA1/START domain
MSNEYDQFIRREIVTTRVFDAPRALVFESWTDPEQLKLWWSPRGFTGHPRKAPSFRAEK